MNHNPHNFKVGNVVIKDKGTSCESEVVIDYITQRSLFVTVHDKKGNPSNRWTIMMNRLSPGSCWVVPICPCNTNDQSKEAPLGCAECGMLELLCFQNVNEATAAYLQQMKSK
jgi:hypothetical protein